MAMKQEVIGPVLGMVVSFVAQVILHGQLRRHRIDGRGGGYRGDSMRTLDPSNYDSVGRRLVPWMWVLILLWLACLVLLVLVLSLPSAAEIEAVGRLR